MKNQNRGFLGLVLLVIIALVLIGGGAYVIIRGNPQTASIPDKTLNSSVTDWKIYTDKQYGFQVSYPSDWEVNNQSFVYKGQKSINFSVGSPVIYTAPGYNQAAMYLVSLSILPNGSVHQNPDDLGGSFIKVFNSGDHQSVETVPVSKNILENTPEYKIGQQIIASVKQINVDVAKSTTLTYDDNFPNDGRGMGFAFTYPSNWTLRKDGNMITLGNINQYHDTLTITKFPGTTITTTSAVRGSVTYYVQNGAIMTTGGTNGTLDAKESASGTAVPLFKIANQWPVYQGTDGVEDRVVYIYGAGFLNIKHSSTSGTSDSELDAFVKSIIFTSNPSNSNM